MRILTEDFDLKKTISGGQMFRYQVFSEGYLVVIQTKRYYVYQKEDSLYIEGEDLNEDFFRHYFDLDRDYKAIKRELIEREPRLEAVIKDYGGLRILKQDPFEMLITFILSQNKAIPQIQVLVERLAMTYGSPYEDAYGIYYAFPTIDQLARVTEEAFRALKVGFRAPYLVDAISKISSGQVDIVTDLDSDSLRDQLMSIKGVGRKVADCILLFAYGRMEVVPMDVWVKRIIAHLYFEEEEVSVKRMLVKASEVFGPYGGIAQQYLFEAYREKWSKTAKNKGN